MLKIYGMMICPDCAECCAELDKEKVEYEFLDFSKETKNLKEFLKIRDNSSLFDKAREEGNIGIPCIVREDGTMTLNWEDCM